MICKHLGECGSCTLYDKTYQDGLNKKVEDVKAKFIDIYIGEFEVITSPDSNFRARAEFKIWHDDDKTYYTMKSKDNKQHIFLQECNMVINNISNIMFDVLDYIQSVEILNNRLFTIEYLSSINNDTMITLIYHKKLDDEWIQEAKKFEEKFCLKIIGRSKNQKLILSNEYITEKLFVDNQDYYYTQYESSFTQPNPYVNTKMLQWACDNSKNNGRDLLELYCGNGNFTMVLSKHFDKVLATEISKASIKSATKNMELNNITNINFARLSSEEFVEAINKVREFNRLKDSNIVLDDYDFSTVFVDPPRAGLDDTTRELVVKYDNILYISCNYDTLHRDLLHITKTHKIEKFAFFDQFAYTTHLECGVKLIKI